MHRFFNMIIYFHQHFKHYCDYKDYITFFITLTYLFAEKTPELKTNKQVNKFKDRPKKCQLETLTFFPRIIIWRLSSCTSGWASCNIPHQVGSLKTSTWESSTTKLTNGENMKKGWWQNMQTVTLTLFLLTHTSGRRPTQHSDSYNMHGNCP